MKTKHLLFIGLVALVLLAVTPIARAEFVDDQGAAVVHAQDTATQTSGLVTAVRSATASFASVEAATAAGYALFPGCVSGPLEGAMGVHFVNYDLVGDGVLDPLRPEALLYEQRDGRMELVGVEYIVIADAWHAHTEGPPVLLGQLFHYVGSPNRYALPALYELHVWAWRDNPNGMFADWNPTVSCDESTAQDAAHGTAH